MRLTEYIGSKIITLCFILIGVLAAASFMAVAGAAFSLIAAAVVFTLLLTAAWILCGWFAEQKKLQKLERVINGLPQKYLLGEVIERPAGGVEQKYYDIMRVISKSAVGIAENAMREKEEYCDYVESWIHEIKTPLTACSLILSNGGDPRKLRCELKRADNLTENILYYARLRTAEKDTVIRKVNIRQLMDDVVKSQMELLIAAGISVEVEGGFIADTDEKQVGFILKQLLINCAKYCRGCRVRMLAENGTVTVEDNGPGIPPHELPRVKDRGFTGEGAGRSGGSTGMGLYIVDGLCRRLGIDFTVASAEGAYTRAVLSFCRDE